MMTTNRQAMSRGDVVRILLIGPLPPPMGGNTRHFSTLLTDLTEDERFIVKLINTSRAEGFASTLQNLRAALTTFIAVVREIGKVDVVSYHASNRGMSLFGPIIVWLCKLFGKPSVLRVFGGSFGDQYEKQAGLRRVITAKSILAADVILLQTKRMIRQLENQGSGRLEWFSTYVRKPVCSEFASGDLSEEDRVCKRFVFLGHLWRVKGVETMLGAAARLPDDVTIDIYGPLDEYRETDIEERGAGRVRYCGFLTHDEVDRKLWEYDCLVLPTYHSSEGYPGVIAEAFAHGLPVITTNWLAIPEIVDSSCGILVEPRDTDAFVAAVSRLYHDRALWKDLRHGAITRAATFDHSIWSGKFEEICIELAAK
jgi:glycosyltransferase involved in cell wall biosynthesis